MNETEMVRTLDWVEIISIYVRALSVIDRLTSGSPIARKLRQAAQVNHFPANCQTILFLDIIVPADLGVLGVLLWKCNKIIEDTNLRRKIASAITVKLAGHIDDALLSLPHSAEIENISEIFERDGLVSIEPPLTEDQVIAMRHYFEKSQKFSRSLSILNFDISDVVQAPHIFNLATHSQALAIAKNFLGGPASIVDLSAWRSLSEQGEKMPGSHTFHRDRDDFRACKMFLYLNDVGPNNGPHMFVKKSHDPSFVASKIEQSTLQVNDFFTGNGRAIAKFAEHIFEDCITELPGNAGMCFMENTYGLHRGKPPTAGMRQIVQVLYATIPYPNRIARLAKVGLERIPDGCDDTPLVKHALKYFLRA